MPRGGREAFPCSCFVLVGLLSIGAAAQLIGTAELHVTVKDPNVSDVNPLYTEARQPTAAYDPRQFQFALKLSW